MQQPTDNKAFAERFEAVIAEQDPSGQASRAFDQVKRDAREIGGDPKAVAAELRRLAEAGDVNAEAAKALVRRMRARTAGIRLPPEAERQRMLEAYARTAGEAQARSEPLPFEPATLEFLRRVVQGMREGGELD